MKDFLTELFAYSDAMNQKVVEVLLNPSSNLPEQAYTLFSHVLNAQHIWNNRILGTMPNYSVWQAHAAEVFLSMMEENTKLTTSIIDKVDDLGLVIQYRMSNGQASENTVRDILFHVVNHCTYHRAQLATLFKQHGANVPITDYISYKR